MLVCIVTLLRNEISLSLPEESFRLDIVGLYSYLGLECHVKYFKNYTNLCSVHRYHFSLRTQVPQSFERIFGKQVLEIKASLINFLDCSSTLFQFPNTYI